MSEYWKDNEPNGASKKLKYNLDLNHLFPLSDNLYHSYTWIVSWNQFSLHQSNEPSKTSWNLQGNNKDSGLDNKYMKILPRTPIIVPTSLHIIFFYQNTLI